MSPEEQALLDSFSPQQRAMWVALEDLWPVLCHIIEAAEVNGSTTQHVPTIPWSEVPFVVKIQFSNTISEEMQVVTAVAAVVLLGLANMEAD